MYLIYAAGKLSPREGGNAGGAAAGVPVTPDLPKPTRSATAVLDLPKIEEQ